MQPALLTAYTLASCLGLGLESARAALRSSRSGLAPCRFESVALDTYVGEIPGVDETHLPEALASYDCRNNRAAEMALVQDGFEGAVAAAAARYGRERIGVVMGTSTA
ncbi:MAG TPA: beta-ketoacyl-[acyl-carrier-protein] synthase II, partial [Usitatibacter sp.]|nr:beta-ketoacyl-[acyl-carrier-protein] synthase II [Usitatibacter sp.]